MNKNPKIIVSALDLIQQMGLLQVEVINLNIGDVLKDDQLVSTIAPVEKDYPTDYIKQGLTLSAISKSLLSRHVNLVKAAFPNTNEQSPLFPNAENGERYAAQNLWRKLGEHSNYPTYERHRIAGLYKICWDMHCQGADYDQIIAAAKNFTRYKKNEKTVQLVEVAISRNPDEYEESYRLAVGSMGLFSGSQTDQRRLNLESRLQMLDSNDQEDIISQANKKLKESGVQLVLNGNQISIETTHIRVGTESLKKLKAKSRKRESSRSK